MRILFIFLLAIITFSCQNIKKSFENQDYEKVVNLFIQKNEKYKNKQEELQLFEKAFHKELEKDKHQIITLKSINSGDKWEQIFNIYSKIENRQNKIVPLLPLYHNDGSIAAIETFDLTAALEESRQNSAQFYYDQGWKLLNSENKSAIRQSVDYFIASKKFYINYKDVNELIDQAEIKGRNYVLLIVDKNPSLLLPHTFEQHILENIKLTKKNSWLSIDYKTRENIQYDYVVKLNLYDIKISPDILKEYNTTEDKTINDGWNYVLDERSNVKKDSLGNDIKIQKFKKISCQVRETRMSKTAQILGDITIYDASNKNYIKNQKCIGNTSFEYSYFQYNGNKEALSQATLNKLGNAPRLFPSSFEMIELSKNELIRCYQDFVSSNYNILVYTL